MARKKRIKVNPRRGARRIIARRLFDDVIDCLYEFDLGQELPIHWPPHVRAAIRASRTRILESRARDLPIGNCKHTADRVDGRCMCCGLAV